MGLEKERLLVVVKVRSIVVLVSWWRGNFSGVDGVCGGGGQRGHQAGDFTAAERPAAVDDVWRGVDGGWRREGVGDREWK